jgi:hypothetical protein
MNDLDLPPRRTMPADVRERIRTKVNADKPRSRHKAPLSVAAAVAVVAAGAVLVAQNTGTPDGDRTATPPTATVVPGTDPQLTVVDPNAQSEDDLDHCWDAVENAGRVADYVPRAQWRPVFTVLRARALGTGALMRVTAFRYDAGTPGFCEVNEVSGPGDAKSWNATVSDPRATIPLATGGGADIHATFLGRSGFLGGAATGVDSVRFRATIPHPDTGIPQHYDPAPILRDGVFLAEIGGLDPGTAIAGGHPGATSSLATTGYRDGTRVADGNWPYDATKDPTIGPSIIYD